ERDHGPPGRGRCADQQRPCGGLDDHLHLPAPDPHRDPGPLRGERPRELADGPGRLAPRCGTRRHACRIGGADLVDRQPEAGQAEREHQHERQQRQGQLGADHALLPPTDRPAPATGHSSADSAVVMTLVTSSLIPPDLITAIRTAANAQAASVPTAYSAVLIPASRATTSSRQRADPWAFL